MVEYKRKDIVRLREADFDELKGQLWFKDNAFEVYKVESDGRDARGQVNGICLN